MITCFKCKTCKFCENIGRAKSQGIYEDGRKYYFCKHPDADKCKEKATRYRDNFIGYGDNTCESPLKLKTHPKWCPLSEERSNEK